MPSEPERVAKRQRPKARPFTHGFGRRRSDDHHIDKPRVPRPEWRGLLASAGFRGPTGQGGVRSSPVNAGGMLGPTRRIPSTPATSLGKLHSSRPLVRTGGSRPCNRVVRSTGQHAAVVADGDRFDDSRRGARAVQGRPLVGLPALEGGTTEAPGDPPAGVRGRVPGRPARAGATVGRLVERFAIPDGPVGALYDRDGRPRFVVNI